MGHILYIVKTSSECFVLLSSNRKDFALVLLPCFFFV